MSPHTTNPPFAPGAQGQPAPQAVPSPRPAASPRVTHALAERHEALWLSLTALHKDIVAIAAKKPHAPVSEPVRIAAEGLLSDAAPFAGRARQRLPVAAPDLAGLAVQLGQALAGLDAWESRQTGWDAARKCRVWLVAGVPLPVLRLRPAVAPPERDAAGGISELRQKVARHIAGKAERAYAAGLRDGRAQLPGAETYPPPARPD